MRNLSILVLGLALAACGSGKKDDGAGRAEGEILPASASDTMLPLDTIRSQAPLAPQAESASKGSKAADDTATAAADAPVTEVPASEPEPAATPEG